MAGDAGCLQLERSRARRVRLERSLLTEQCDQPCPVAVNDGVCHTGRAYRTDAAIQLERPSQRRTRRVRLAEFAIDNARSLDV